MAPGNQGQKLQQAFRRRLVGTITKKQTGIKQLLPQSLRLPLPKLHPYSLCGYFFSTLLALPVHTFSGPLIGISPMPARISGESDWLNLGHVSNQPSVVPDHVVQPVPLGV